MGTGERHSKIHVTRVHHVDPAWLHLLHPAFVSAREDTDIFRDTVVKRMRAFWPTAANRRCSTGLRLANYNERLLKLELPAGW